MITCVLADDEPLALELMRRYAERHDALSVVGAFTSAREALEALQQLRPQLAFLDICMPGLTGLQLAEAARTTGTRVVFVTAHRDYALDGFRVNALDYLLKPASYDDFCEAVDRAMAVLAAPAHAVDAPRPAAPISVKVDYRQVRIDPDDVLYVEGLRDYVKIYTASRPRPLITQLSLKAMDEMLPAPRFVRVHRSYIVAMDKVSSLGRTSLRIRGVDIPIGATYRQSINRSDDL